MSGVVDFLHDVQRGSFPGARRGQRLHPQATTMECEWIEGGFFIIAGGSFPKKRDGLLPARLVTVSTCTADSYPDDWALPWVETESARVREIRKSLPLGDDEFEALRAWVSRALDDGRLGWPNVFLALRDALEFRSRFLAAVKDARILALSLAVDVAEDFLREEAPQANHGASGVWTALARGLPTAHDEALLGFDVLGADYGGRFHSFVCNGLERELHERLGVTFNRYGLIPDYASAVVAAEYMNRDETGTEPVAWYPARIDGCEFEESWDSRSTD